MMYSIARVAVVACLFVAPANAQQDSEEPRESGIVEKARGRLMQIDVTARGPAETLASLTAEDFALAVGREDITEFVLDRVCLDQPMPPGLGTGSPDRRETADQERVSPRLRTLLYFDQVHLTFDGRSRSLELARELVRQILARGGAEVMIVSAGRRLERVVEWSSDESTLLAGLERVATEPDHALAWADGEDQRVGEMMSAVDRYTQLMMEALQKVNLWERQTGASARTQLAQLGVSGERFDRAQDQERQGVLDTARMLIESGRTSARSIARDLSRKEASRTVGGLGLLAVSLEHLDRFAPPKAVVYFADTMRANPGDFYVDIMSAAEKANSRASSSLFSEFSAHSTAADPGGTRGGIVSLSNTNYVREFQTVIDLATEKGVRFYTVLARGLAERTSARPRYGSWTPVANVDPQGFQSRYKDAENALVGFARETGGKSFLGAADGADIASRILDDLSCLFVLSFRPIKLKTDRPTGVFIDVDRPGVELQYRPKLIALSDKVRSEMRLANAFWAGGSEKSPARVAAIPTGFHKGKYTVLVQFAIPGAETMGSDWDMGVTAVVGKSTTVEASGRVAINQPGLPLVFEAELAIKPGDYTITAVARNRDHEEILSTKTAGSLADPDHAEPFVAGTTFLQRVPGAFARSKATKTSGSMAHGPGQFLRPDRATGILALVCGGKTAAPVTVVRRLEGATVVSFDPIEIDFRQERCGLLVDTVDGGLFTSGSFEYVVDLAAKGEVRRASAEEFLVVTPEEMAAARAVNE